MRARFSALKDYRCLVESKADRPKPEHMLLRYTFSKPRRIRMEFQRPRRGAVAIYTGGDQVRVRRFRWLPIARTFAITDVQMKSVQGRRVDQTDFGAFLDDFSRDAGQGTLTGGGEEVLEGRRTHRLELVRTEHREARDYRKIIVFVTLFTYHSQLMPPENLGRKLSGLKYRRQLHQRIRLSKRRFLR
ncbi:MAG: hypothetical protein EXS64_19130 [Candidatus Latescibacteria bacterium]|nr:hypothetical protein [Candidatus Latescibacterota bacterium]